MRLGSALRRRRRSIRGAKFRLREPLHDGAVLAVTLPAAALFLAAVLGHHVVVAAVVTKDAPAEPEKQRSPCENMKHKAFIFHGGI